MIVFDLAHSGGSSRVAIIGSCRVRTPILTLKSSGRLDLAISQPALTHSFAEGRQNMRHAFGQARVPDAFAPYVFETAQSPAAERYSRQILDGIDTVIVEMCDTRQIRKDQWFFQNNYFARQFVQKRAAELLDWYRAFSKAKPISEELISASLSKLRASGQADDGTVEDILRNARLETPDRDKIIEDALSLALDRTKRWIFVSHFSVGSDHGTIMSDRRRLASYVEDAATAAGAEFFDPSRLIDHYGRDRVLRGGGTDIYEYDWDFIPVMGEILLNIVQQGTGADLTLPELPSSGPRPEKTADQKPSLAKNETLEQMAERVNKLLVKLHRDRVSSLGMEKSGLYDRFKTMLDAGQIVRPRDVEVVRLVLEQLPIFSSYTVLKAGLGAVPLLLALSGLRSTAFEASGHRVSAIEAAVNALTVSRKGVADKVAVKVGLAPESMDERSALCIAVGYVSRGAVLEQERILKRLANFDAILVEPRTFLRHRTPADQAQVANELNGIGFMHVADVGDGFLFASKQGATKAAAA